MIESDDDTCGRCRFCAHEAADDAGECRRYPPSIVIADEGEFTGFPTVPLAWWCGEFSRRVS